MWILSVVCTIVFHPGPTKINASPTVLQNAVSRGKTT